jgi:hypothetical protein
MQVQPAATTAAGRRGSLSSLDPKDVSTPTRTAADSCRSVVERIARLRIRAGDREWDYRPWQRP